MCKEIEGFPYFPGVIDAHVHVLEGGLEAVDRLVSFQQEFGYQTSNFLSCECMDDAAQNALGIYLKLKYPEYYAFGGFHYRFPYHFKKEAETLLELGFDGMKMVENKPNLRKKLQMASNDKRYDEFYSFMEKNKAPMIVHVADPEEFWDNSTVTPWALENGYFYGDGSFVEKETIYTELFDVLNRYPKLNISMAHLLFMSGDIKRLTKLMEQHENLKLDIVAGTEMYFNFAKAPDSWREFFITYQNRILFGTDNMNLDKKGEIEVAQVINRLENEFITKNGDIPIWDTTVKGIGLPEHALEQIYRSNFLCFAGKKPKEIDKQKAAEYLRKRLSEPQFLLKEKERKLISDVLVLCEQT